MDTRDERGLFAMPAADMASTGESGFGKYESINMGSVYAGDGSDPLDSLPAKPEALDIFSKAAVLHLQFRRLGTSRKVASEAVDVKRGDADRDADKSLLSISKRILEAPELKAIEQHDAATARYIESQKAGPAFANQGGFHLIPLASQPDIIRYLDMRERERADLVESFLTVMDSRIAETRKRLGPLGRNVSYPTRSEAEAAFGVTRSFMTFGYTDPAAAREWQQEALSECRATLRAGFADVVSRLAERLQPGSDGKPKVFRDSLVENFESFVQAFEARNLADDTELGALVAQARRVMSGVDAGELRTRASLRRVVGTAVEAIDKAAAALVTDKPTRYYGRS